jgi:hypothetical protein
MLKKIFRDFFILFGLAALSASTSRTFMKFISEKRDGDKWWSTNPMTGGNLASISDLTFLKKFYCPPDRQIKHAPAYNRPENTVLYLDGDSYTWSLRDSNFAGISGFHFISRYEGGCFHLDTAKKNILIIAITESVFRTYFRDLRMLNEVYDPATKKDLVHLYQFNVPAHAQLTSFLFGFSISGLFNKNINQNLQCNLFNYNFITPMFLYKGSLNYFAFNRASGDVVISKDKNFLFLKQSVSATDTGSTYFPIQPGEIAHLVDNLNNIYDHYKKSGFKEIYLTIMPNTASIVQPEGYNNLIPLIQNDPGLKIKIIDVYYTFKKSSRPLFYHGDTHWNLEGQQMWVDMVNQILTN